MALRGGLAKVSDAFVSRLTVAACERANCLPMLWAFLARVIAVLYSGAPTLGAPSYVLAAVVRAAALLMQAEAILIRVIHHFHEDGNGTCRLQGARQLGIAIRVRVFQAQALGFGVEAQRARMFDLAGTDIASRA